MRRHRLVGIEALSRGAGKVYFVDSSAQAAGLIQRNLSSLGVVEGFEILREEIGRVLRRLEDVEFTANFIFLDPPYAMEDLYLQTLQQVSQSRLQVGQP